MEKLMFWVKKVMALFSFVGSSNSQENILLDADFWSEIDVHNERDMSVGVKKAVQNVIDAIDKGANIHAYDKNGLTPLHFAVGRGSIPKLVTFLLDKGANIEARDKHGQTPLYEALNNGWVYHAFSNSGEIAFDMSRTMVKLLIDRGANIQVCDIKKRTPLHIAAMCNETTIVVASLLNKGANCLAKDIDGKTPYDYAQKNISPAKGSISRRIYEAQKQQEPQEPIDPEYQKELDYERKHKLANAEFWFMESPGSHYVDRVYEAISDGADVNALGWSEVGVKMTPLLMVLEKNEQTMDVILALLDCGADVNMSDEDGRTPLHLASGYSAQPGGEEIVDWFLESDADIHACDKDGMTPLHWAAKNHWYGTKIIERLLEEGADINARDNDDRTHLHWAARNNFPEVVEFFLDKGLDIKARTKQGRTPLHEAMYQYGDTCLPVTELLLNRGANIEVRDNNGKTALHLAVVVGQFQLIELLLTRGANTEARTEEGLTPLHLATKGNRGTRTIEVLLDSGANATAQDKDGKTPFDYARENKYLKGSDVYWQLNDAHFNNEQRTVQRAVKVKRRRRIQPYLRLQKRKLGSGFIKITAKT